ncbi:MAG TPA: UbiA family prenyltransferase [Candidatus Binataceae bacterium]|nr:UbiA family prenyltransferase [Candidatus Binataceae bacterium]
MTDASALSRGGGARPGAMAVWIRAIRAPSLSAAAIPVLLGVAIAARDGFFAPGRIALALIGAMAIQAGTNLINDYYDHQSGADWNNSLGPSMAIQRGLLTPEQVKELNLALMRSVQLHLEYGLLMIAAFLAAALVRR